MSDIHQALQSSIAGIIDNYKNEQLFILREKATRPSRSAVIAIIRDIRRVIFPGYFEDSGKAGSYQDYATGYAINHIHERLYPQILSALEFDRECEDREQRATEVCAHFFQRLPFIQKTLLKDVQAGYDGDPAAESMEDIIISYPGLFAVYVYRIAHELYLKEVPLIPRMMTEYAHSRTGIDINPGATIGEYFFIDHGTGVVIGETTVIGDNVKLYQGVTLGALSTRMGQQLSGVRRHPTIEDNVTIYSGSTILGGDTVIGEGSIIGGNAFITESVPKFTKASAKMPELTFEIRKEDKLDGAWDWVI